MEGIKFNEKLGIVDLVLSGEKTMFRVSAKSKVGKVYPYKYKVGQRIVVLQPYKDIDIDEDQPVFEKTKEGDIIQVRACDSKGWNNASSVDIELMPHIIEITSSKTELFNDISDEDIFKEGIKEMSNDIAVLEGNMPFDGYSLDGKTWLGNTPFEAFSVIAEKITKKDLWKYNKQVDVYEFKLVR